MFSHLGSKDTSVVRYQKLVNASESRHLIDEDIEPGTYQVRVFSLSNNVKGEAYAMDEFVVGKYVCFSP